MTDGFDQKFGFEHLVFKMQRFRYFGFDGAGKRNFFNGKRFFVQELLAQVDGIKIDLFDFSAGPDQDTLLETLVTGHPGKTRITAENAPGFLLVFIQRVVQGIFQSKSHFISVVLPLMGEHDITG